MGDLLLDEYPLVILPRLAAAIGLNEAIVLQQVHYWVQTYRKIGDEKHYQDGEWWVWNTGPEWQTNFPFWSESTVWRTITALRNPHNPKPGDKRTARGPLLITGCYNPAGYDRTLWYRIDYEELARIEGAILDETPVDQEEEVEANEGASLDGTEAREGEALAENEATSVDETPSCHFDKMGDEEIPILSDCQDGSGQSDKMDLVNLDRPIPETTIDHSETNAHGARTARAEAEESHALFEELFGPATTEGPPPTPEGMTPEAFRHQQAAQALEAAYARRAEEPWLGWGSESRVVERYQRAGLEKTTILRLCWALERHFGLHPVWGNAGHEGFWMREAADLLEAAEGNVELVLDTARQMRADRLTISSPKSLFKKTVATMAERRSGIEGAGTPGIPGPGNGRTAAPGRAPMAHAPAFHAPASHTSAPQATGPHASGTRQLTPEEIQIRDMLAADAARARDPRARAPGPGPDDSPPGELPPEELQARTIYATEEA